MLILVAIVLLTIQLAAYSRQRANYPAGMRIAGIPVGEMDRQGAAERLLEVYSLPIELVYEDQVILLNPAVVGFEADIESMLAAADLEREGGSFWTGFWNDLWGGQSSAQDVPLTASFSENLLRSYLENEIGLRYNKQPQPAQPIPGTVNFTAGIPGTAIDLDSAVLQIEQAMQSPVNRSVSLPLSSSVASARPSFNNLEILLKQTIDLTGFDGITGVYFLDLQTAEELHFIYQNGQDISTQPDLAFTAASMIKLPIMVSVYKRVGDNPNEEVVRLLSTMIEQSGNEPSDWLMQQVIDPNIGPLVVTEDLQALGLENTFLAGFFGLGSPLLARYETPANLRTDVSTDPDVYNQTTLTDMGMLLADVYQCAETGGGTFAAVFPGELTQAECQQMIELLSTPRTAVLLEASAPSGTRIAHKHGWVTNVNGVINTIGDAGIIYSPNGDYAVVIFTYHPVQLVWEPVSVMMRDVSRAVYNYFNPPTTAGQ
ncbi:MAG: hypothetical protein DWQ07_23895 [Chloroflexi bacterium]|nr:MAG: hypothetical protein DWQ07_23895 [Chloroflexota bacterium]MBL1194191.1 hypothetical protein [Chloroflexota bacterium]